MRAVGTNTLRVAKNAAAFLKQAEAALGFPIEVVAGREEARLIYVGVAHSLPLSKDKRLVVDIGGGSTEFIIGRGLKPLRLDSLYMGCVSYSLKYFPDGKVTKGAMKQAELAARNELQTMVAGFSKGQWQEAVGSSGSARALSEILQLNGYSESGITPDGLERLRSALIKAGDVERLDLAGLSSDRLPVLPGGLAIMSAALSELGIESMRVASGSMRQGILYDLLGRFQHHDMRDITVSQFMQRYHVDSKQARRVASLALSLYRRFTAGRRCQRRRGAALHRVGRQAARNRHLGRLQRLSQAFRLHRAERRHAGLLENGAVAARHARARASPLAQENLHARRRDRRLAHGDGLAAGGADLPQPRRHSAAGDRRQR